MSEKTQRRALGRGLSALLPNTEGDRTRRGPAPDRTYFRAPIEDVYPMQGQPRRHFSDDELNELAQSIRAHGVIQPLIVRPRREGGFTLIAGERRWRAAQRAGEHEIPVVVQKVSDGDAFERALIENIQRSDLNPIETALAYQRLIDDFGLSQEQVATKVGKDRSSVANSVRLLKLPPAVQEMVSSQTLSMGHARALLGAATAGDIERLARKVVAEQLSVRATEKLVRTGSETSKKAAKPATKKSASVRDLEERLTRSLGAVVKVNDRGQKGGSIEITYADLDQLDGILEKLL